MQAIEYQHENHFIRRSSVRYVFPPMIGMIFAQIAPVVDGICVSSSLGEEALSAIGAVGPINYVFNIIAALGGIGCGVVISKCSGAGEKDKAARAFSFAMFFMVIASIIMSIGGVVFADGILNILSATSESYAFAREYLIVTLIGAVFPVLNFAGDYILANDNHEKLAMAGDIVGAVVNIIVDFAGVYLFHCGIWVVAFGSVFGSFCCCLVYMIHFRKPDRLCRFVPLKRVPGDPTFWEIVKPGTAEGLMYVMSTVQLIVQNAVLCNTAGTLGISNSAVIENLQLVITIIIAGATDAIYPMAAAYCGEQNQSGMLMVKRMLNRFGFFMLAPAVVLLCVFPQLMIMPYKIEEPLMLQSLPLAIRIISIGSLLTLINMLMIDYLSAIEQEGKANIALLIQSVFQIAAMLILDNYLGMDSPWYATLIGNAASLIYLCFFCNKLTEGIFIFRKKNLLVLRGGNLDAKQVESWKTAAQDVLTGEQLEIVQEKLFQPLLASLPAGVSPYSSFTVLQRDDDMRAVILRYESKQDYIEGNTDIQAQDEDETEFEPDVCIRSEFLHARRLMIVLSEKAA